MQYLKNIVPLCMLLCTALIVQAQSQLPSLFDDTQEQNTYLQNTVLKPGENAEEKIRSQIFIKTTISKKTCYIGEPVLVVYQLYTALYCQPKVVKQPSFNGCSVVEMTTDEPEYLEKKDGRIYRVLLIRRVQLTPLQEGELNIPPAIVNNEVGFTSTDNPYRVQNYSAAVSSKQETIQVRALPAAAPAGYSGIIGKFTISAKVDSTTIPQGENDLLEVTIAGEGNIDAIQIPYIAWPQSIEHFEGNDSQHINKMSFPVGGNKTFVIPFIGIKKGRTIIPQVAFTFFNTASQNFETVITQPIAVTITQPLPTGAKDILVITEAVSNSKYLWFVPGIALVVLTVWVITNKRKENNLRETQAQNIIQNETAGKEANLQSKQGFKNEHPSAMHPEEKPDLKLLLQALSEAEDNYTFFTNAKILLTAALPQTLASSEQSEKQILKTLEESNSVFAEEVRRLYALCNQSLYSPAVDDDRRTALIEQLSAVVYKLEHTQPVYL